MNRKFAKAKAQIGSEAVVLEIADLLRDPQLQVRTKLNEGMIKRYALSYQSDVALPAITVADVKGTLTVIDGWHRLSALERIGRTSVSAIVVNATRSEAGWLAAQANLSHGVPLKSAELRRVFKAYIGARRHILPNGSLKSYRDIARDLGGGRAFTTIRNWTKKDFPDLFRRMAGSDVHGSGGLRHRPFDRGPAYTVSQAIRTAITAGKAVSDPQARGALIEEAARLVAALRAQGPSEEPDF